MEIHYEMTRRDAWRGNLHIMLHKPAMWMLFLGYAVLITWYAYWQYPSVRLSLHLRSPHIWWLPVIFFGSWGVQALLGFISLGHLVNTRYAETTPPLLTITTLTPQALEDTARKMKDDVVILVPMRVLWKDITHIQWYDGDFYFWRKNGCNVIPRSAFDNPRHAQQFLELAEFYWRTAKHGVLAPESQDAWPPAPRPGA